MISKKFRFSSPLNLWCIDMFEVMYPLLKYPVLVWQIHTIQGYIIYTKKVP